VHSGSLLTYSAYQAVLPNSGYGVALLFNRSMGAISGSTKSLLAYRWRHAVAALNTGLQGLRGLGTSSEC
jgi:hypothetical protein